MCTTPNCFSVKINLCTEKKAVFSWIYVRLTVFTKPLLWKYESGVDAFYYKSKTYTQKDAINVYTTGIKLRKKGEKLKKYAEYRIQGVA